MIYFLAITLLFAGSLYLSKTASYGSWKDILGMIVSVFCGLYLGVGGLISICAQTLEFPAFKAKYDQVSALLQVVKSEAAEDLVGQVAEINATISQNQEYNKITFCDPYISDKFDMLTPLTLPEHLKKSE